MTGKKGKIKEEKKMGKKYEGLTEEETKASIEAFYSRMRISIAGMVLVSVLAGFIAIIGKDPTSNIVINAEQRIFLTLLMIFAACVAYVWSKQKPKEDWDYTNPIPYY